VQNIFKTISDPFANNKVLEKEFYNHISYLNFDRLRIFSYFVLPFSVIILISDFYAKSFWQKGQVDQFIQLDIILLSCACFVIYFTNFRKPKTQDHIKPWMVYFVYAYVFVHLIWSTAITSIEESTANSLPTFLIGVYSGVLLFIINGTYLLITLIFCLGFLFISLIISGKSFNEVLAQYYFTIALIVLAWIISRILYKTRLTTFLATKELENAKNSLDLKVKERTYELQRANEQLTNEISERNKYEKILEREKKKAQEADNLKSIFLANMSHEIRTPLNGILGFSDLLYKQTLPAHKVTRYLDIIHNNGHQLLKIIDDILDISMIASNQLSINNVNFKFGFIFPDAYEHFNRQKKIDEKENLEIICIPPEKSVEYQIFSDPVRIQQVLNNLIHNGLKFTDTGYIKFSGKIESDFALVYVEDSGIGVSANLRRSIFKRFRQGDESSNRIYGGTGLGLSISKGIVELLGGMIWLDSTYTEGARFCFSIPVHPFNPDEILPCHPAYYDDLRKKRILLIENKYAEYSFLTESFKDIKIINYRTEINKLDEQLTDFKPDLIIFDLLEVEPNHIELLKLVRSLCSGSKIFYIIPESEIENTDHLNNYCDRVFHRPLNIQFLFTECLKVF
jgi:signal transduction histidine kinase